MWRRVCLYLPCTKAHYINSTEELRQIQCRLRGKNPHQTYTCYPSPWGFFGRTPRRTRECGASGLSPYPSNSALLKGNPRPLPETEDTERHFTAYLGLWLERGIHSLPTATLSRSGSGAAAPTGLLPPLLGPPSGGPSHLCNWSSGNITHHSP
jgi:hypothetical protein